MGKEDGKLVLVTGASGFVGTHVVVQLLEQGYRVRGTIRDPTAQYAEELRQLMPDAKYPLELVKADLDEDKGWDKVMEGCWAVMHVAALLPPFDTAQAKNVREEHYMESTVRGTERVLRAASNAGVKKFIFTGTLSAVASDQRIIDEPTHTFTEEDWIDPDDKSNHNYARAKTYAELAVWKFLEDLPESKKFDVTSIMPGMVFGPALIARHVDNPQQQLLKAFMLGKIPAIPYIQQCVSDVRDVAVAHIKSLTTPSAVNKRVLVNTDTHWISDVTKIAAEEFRPQGYRVSTFVAPYFALYIASFFIKDLTIYRIVEKYGKPLNVSNDLMKSLYGIKPRSLKETMLDTVYAMIKLGALQN